MSQWSPDQYLKFAGPRFRPGLDLLARVAISDPAAIFDLGCGTGALTQALAERWPGAAVSGVDSSPEMLAKARAENPGISWIQAAVADWAPDTPADVIFSNACLQWLDSHTSLFPRLLAALRSGGMLAVQMPRNYASPLHTCIQEAAAGRGAVQAVVREQPVASPDTYFDILASLADELEIWETIYLHVLEGNNPVAEWTRGTVLKPLLDAIADASERQAFFDDYSARVQAAYPRRDDGKTLCPFRRLFIVARA